MNKQKTKKNHVTSQFLTQPWLDSRKELHVYQKLFKNQDHRKFDVYYLGKSGTNGIGYKLRWISQEAEDVSSDL
jgi:hypothetical protein